MKLFPNQRVKDLYERVKGKEFTHSPTFQRFKDKEGNEDYDYWSMMWLLDNGYLHRQPWNIKKGFAFIYSTQKP